MRRSLSLFLVVLLVLRGLLGDAMAMGNLPMAAAHSASAGQHAHAAGAHHSPDGMAAAHGAPTMAAHHTATHGTPAALNLADICNAGAATPGCGHGHEGPCTDCGVCHSAMFAVYLSLSLGEPSPGTLAIASSVRFASALPAQATKPPIA